MRRPIIAGNWKMNKTIAEAQEFVNALKATAAARPDVEVLICPPFTALYSASSSAAGTSIGIAGQDLFWKKQGAYTSEISATMLKDAGATSVIIGHSETRGRFGVPEPDFTGDVLLYFHESDETVNRKAHEALNFGLQPIICVGETLAEREEGHAEKIVTAQVKAALAGFSDEEVKGIVFAYEPVWAIGTGVTCDAPEADKMCGVVRSAASSLFGTPEVGDTLRVQYGGSVKPDNAGDLLSRPNIDGALVGGASLKVEDFAAIVMAAPHK